MKVALAFLLGALAIGALFFCVVSHAGHASAAPADDPTPRLFDGDDSHPEYWLRRSVVYCAAETIGIDYEQVKLGLRLGASLKEIGIRNGVRPERLEDGILRCERELLARKVAAGELDPAQARRIFDYLSDNIERIISYHWNPSDEVLTDAP
jgi:hypothetical protein